MQQGSELSPKSKNDFCGNKKAACSQAAFGKEAKEEGKISQGRRCTMQSQLAPRHTD
jgi:hypothetical protein